MKKLKIKVLPEPKPEVFEEVEAKNALQQEFKVTGRFEVVKIEGGYQVLGPGPRVVIVGNYVNPDLSDEENHNKAVRFQEDSNRYIRGQISPDAWSRACEKAVAQGL